jgi:FKBP-type peptidyl-prolyl cis-trans isomerase SlyD
MQIAMNTVVTMTYELKDAEGNILESSKEPVTYLHGGYDNIFPKVEEVMHGKKIGDTIELGLEPSEAFGEYDAELVQIEPKSAFPEADDKVIVDGNHPWAGQKVIFKAVVKDVRLANEEEVGHKHVNGAGGPNH